MEREVTVLNQLGLHARPAAEFVRMVLTFRCTVTIRKGDERFSASSILDVLMANLEQGTKIILEAEGDDAESALTRLEALMVEFCEQEERGGML